MIKEMLMIAAFIATRLLCFAQSPFDSLCHRLSTGAVQEKVYLHIDNNCYFRGDTIWYKAYVVRADNHRITDMSRIVYVELVSPDGLVVERQKLSVSPDGYGNGDFILYDSLYSGYYELRAYTKWMMNFKVSGRDYSRRYREQFYNDEMAADFFRDFGTVYSRVIPVYEPVGNSGDYGRRYITGRPKQRLDAVRKPGLSVSFFPEGGRLVRGIPCRVAFEATDEEGRNVDVEGTIGGVRVSTSHCGRGVCEVMVPETGELSADFTYDGKSYRFALPDASPDGVSLRVDGGRYVLRNASSQSRNLAVATLCRGVLRDFRTLDVPCGGESVIDMDMSLLPCGVNNVVVFDERCRIVADRLFFVRGKEAVSGKATLSSSGGELPPFSRGAVSIHAPRGTRSLSVSVRDASTSDATYPAGNIMTDLLLSSELRGFVANPGYYFESDDSIHNMALDLLMLVQGWRRYDVGEMHEESMMRYKPEKGLCVEGSVYKVPASDDIKTDEIGWWRNGIFGLSLEEMSQVTDDNDARNRKWLDMLQAMDSGTGMGTATDPTVSQNVPAMFVSNGGTSVETVGFGESVAPLLVEQTSRNNKLGKEVYIDGELVLGRYVKPITQMTHNGGKFCLQLPAFYEYGYLFLSAFDSDADAAKVKKQGDAGRLDETSVPRYYVKQDLFYPVFADKYNYYQCHAPVGEPSGVLVPDGMLTEDTLSISKMDRTLGEVEVRARHRRGKRAVDFSKPAYVDNVYEMYNLVTDRGLSFGTLNFRRFPYQIGLAVFGNMGLESPFNVDAYIDQYCFYRSYKPTEMSDNKPYGAGSMKLYEDLHLRRLMDVRLFTDCSLRTLEEDRERSSVQSDVAVEFVTIPDDATQYSFRDRRVIVEGITFPNKFYSPDYSQRPLPELRDYRRTLYWNANAKPDAEGNVSIEFYNNSRRTRYVVEAMGIAEDGTPVWTE